MPTIKAGAQIYKSELQEGICGCLVRFAETPGHVYALTAAHVLAVADPPDSGAPVLAPGQEVFTVTPAGGILGKIYTWPPWTGSPTVDSVLIAVDADDVDPKIDGLGAPTGFNEAPAAGDHLRIVSIQAPGVVQTTTIDFVDNGPGFGMPWPEVDEPVPYVGQIVCSTAVTVHGDSGAMALDAGNRIVGMVVGVVDGIHFADGRDRTLITPIKAIRNPANWYDRTLQLVI